MRVHKIRAVSVAELAQTLRLSTTTCVMRLASVRFELTDLIRSHQEQQKGPSERKTTAPFLGCL